MRRHQREMSSSNNGRRPCRERAEPAERRDVLQTAHRDVGDPPSPGLLRPPVLVRPAQQSRPRASKASELDTLSNVHD
ncbi:unnamed protein product [Merluccius merluccius]